MGRVIFSARPLLGARGRNLIKRKQTSNILQTNLCYSHHSGQAAASIAGAVYGPAGSARLENRQRMFKCVDDTIQRGREREGMKPISVWLKKLLFPGGKPVFLLAVLGAVSLYLVFAAGLGETPLAYPAYTLSAYALTVLTAWIVTKAVPALNRLLHSFSLSHRYLTDSYFKVRASLLLSFLINLGYGIFKLVYAALYVSFWDGALAVYNILLCAVRFYLLRRVPGGAQAQDRNRELRQ